MFNRHLSNGFTAAFLTRHGFRVAMFGVCLMPRESLRGMLEKDIAARRPAYRDFIVRTSAFIPWPGRRHGAHRGGESA